MNKHSIKSICTKLNISWPSVYDTIFLYQTITQSQTHSYSDTICLASSMYLSSKINEENKRIRDILNIIYFENNRNDILSSSTRSKHDTAYWKELNNETYSSQTIAKTMENITIENYQLLKEEVFWGEQHLLRILNYKIETICFKTIFSLYFLACENLLLKEDVIQNGISLLTGFLDKGNIEMKEIVNDKHCVIYSTIHIAVEWNRRSLNSKGDDKVNNEIDKILKGYSVNEGDYYRYTNLILESFIVG